MADTLNAIRATVARRFALVAGDPGRESKFPVGPASAKGLGYDPQEIDALPSAVAVPFCGIGNPLALGELRRGQTVLDLGAAPRRPAPAADVLLHDDVTPAEVARKGVWSD
jgi:hypothetical protein